MSQPKRVLQVLSSTTRAGVETLTMNWYRQMDREKIQFDFITHDQFTHDYDEEMLSMGARIFTIPLLSKVGIRNFVSIVENIIKENGPYEAIHAHTDHQAGFSAWAAKSQGIERRFCHAHTSLARNDNPVLQSKIMLGRMVTFQNATKLFACSPRSGKTMYGGHAMKNGRVELLNNGIDLKPFTVREPNMREKLCRELGIPVHAKIIGHVARVNPVKNHEFTFEMARVVRERGLPWIFLCVGGGLTHDKISEQCYRMGLSDTVRFLGSRADIARIMMCLDAAILPSLAEGQPLATIEMQAAGTPILTSMAIPKEIDMGLGLFYQRKLKDGASAWVDDIVSMLQMPSCDKDYCVRTVASRGFDSIVSAQRIARMYLGETV